jgi:GntR family transcriptional regulator
VTTRLPSTAVCLDREALTPVHVQIADWLRAAITAGELRPGHRLPGERALADTLGVSRMTLRQALGELENAGALVRVPGRSGGAYVAEPQVDVDLTELAGLTEQLRRAHRRAGAKVLEARRTTARSAGLDVTESLRVIPAARVVLVSRLRSADGIPLALERSWLPARLVPGLLEQRLTGSLYSLLARRYQLRMHSAVERLEPVNASGDDAATLGVQEGAPLMLVRRTAFTEAGTPVEYARDLFRADRVSFVVRRGPAGPAAVRAEAGSARNS